MFKVGYSRPITGVASSNVKVSRAPDAFSGSRYEVLLW